MINLRRFRRRTGQSAVEYLLTTVTLVTVFAGMYGFIQSSAKTQFQAAARMILRSYF
jgi:hypothetical protein